MTEENPKKKKEEEQPEKPEEKPTPTPLNYEDFKRAFPVAYMKICPYFCVVMKCPYIKECWK